MTIGPPLVCGTVPGMHVPERSKMSNYKLDKITYKILLKTVAPFIKSEFNFKQNLGFKAPEGPFLVICNHVTNLDMVWMADTINEHMYFVSSEHVVRSGLGGLLLNKVFHPIVREKATVGLSTVVEMKKHLQAGHNVCIFAEGLRSSNGISFPMVESTAAVVKKLGFTVITCRLHGGFLTSPRWSSDLRPGGMTSEVVNIYTPEQIKEMSVQELNISLNNDIFEDAYAYNRDRKIKYKSKTAAEGIEYELVMCPKCQKLGTITSKGNKFSCPCGMSGIYDEYGLLHGDFEFETITEWDAWEQEEIAKLPDIEVEEILASFPNQNLNEIQKGHKDITVDSGDVVITNRAISVGNTRIPFENIRGFDLFLHGYLLIMTKDKKYYEIKNKKAKFPGYLFILLMRRYKVD